MTKNEDQENEQAQAEQKGAQGEAAKGLKTLEAHEASSPLCPYFQPRFLSPLHEQHLVIHAIH